MLSGGRHRKERGGAVLLCIAVMLLLAGSATASTLAMLLAGRQAIAARLDSEIALRAAEAALVDGERDAIAASQARDAGEVSTHPARVRRLRWPPAGDCGDGLQQGICTPSCFRQPVWRAWLDATAPIETTGIALGTFTARSDTEMQAGTSDARDARSGALPRYVIELLPGVRQGYRRDTGADTGADTRGDAGANPRAKIATRAGVETGTGAGDAATANGPVVRITAVGIGRTSTVRAVVQSLFQL